MKILALSLFVGVLSYLTPVLAVYEAPYAEMMEWARNDYYVSLSLPYLIHISLYVAAK